MCKTCYNRLDSIVQKEEDIQKKRQLISRAKEEVYSIFIAGIHFFYRRQTMSYSSESVGTAQPFHCISSLKEADFDVFHGSLSQEQHVT